MKKSITLSFIFFIGYIGSLSASHYAGGSIRWECLPNGNFRFVTTFYEDCYGYGSFPNVLTMSSNSPAGSFSMQIAPGYPKDISPNCNSGFTGISCSGMPVGSFNMGALRMIVYTTDSTYPNGIQIQGVPPPTGWAFYFSSCCHGPSSNISSQPGWAIRAIMYPYNNQNTYPCFDNAPALAAEPRHIYQTGINNVITTAAVDIDMDSLVFMWGIPWQSNNYPLTSYSSGYNSQSPLPNTFQNSTNIAYIDSISGNIFFNSVTSGAFLTNRKAVAYRNGIKISETFVELKTIISPNTSSNIPPSLAIDTLSSFSNLIVDTVNVGDTVQFGITATDFQLLSNGTPQTMRLEALGAQFGSYIPATSGSSSTLSDSSGCLSPPCATLTPGANSQNPINAQFATSTQFTWVTSCAHIAVHKNHFVPSTYEFTFRVKDDYCPVPGETVKTYRVVIMPKAPLSATDIRAVQVDSLGSVKVLFNTVTDSNKVFDSYSLYGSNWLNGSFFLLDSTSNIKQNHLKYSGSMANLQKRYLYLTTNSGCSTRKVHAASNKVSSIYLSENSTNGLTANLSWNHMSNDLASTASNPYKITYQLKKNGSIWNIDTSKAPYYIDIMNRCPENRRYQVKLLANGLVDSIGNPITAYSTSNFTSYKNYHLPLPLAPSLLNYNIDTALNYIQLIFNHPNPQGIQQFYVYKYNHPVWQLYDSLINNGNYIYTDLLWNNASPQDYKIAAVDSCKIESGMSNILSVGINDLTNTSSIILYPNPTKGIVYMDIPDIQKIEVYDASMKLLFIKTENLSSVSLEEYPMGMYTFKMYSATNFTIKKIIKK